MVNLGALWAGPLSTRLLGLTGAGVIDVESTTRPDGARQGNRGFYDWLHAGHASRQLDFASEAAGSARGTVTVRSSPAMRSPTR